MPLTACQIPTPLGDMLALASDAGLCLLEFIDGTARLEQELAQVRAVRGLAADGPSAALEQLQAQLDGYFAGQRQRFDVPLDWIGTPFQMRVWRALLAIPYGATWSYAQEARQIGQSAAVRAVAAANGHNKIAIVVPCHRVIGGNGALTGYGGGLARKRWLLDLERQQGTAAENPITTDA
ncbi:MAG: methylated-DNA--[protein]-cysteine S-methyltransferase [Burkholderiaceae bacterium]|jgi:methylated-DNA-[protein]-cysteine S-methyltransferase|nr:methylated-DNA--[protein]-cysteine S-methyltransferase [Burkholderiaceae bacterium]